MQRIASLREAREGDLTFLSHQRYLQQARETKGSVLFAPKDYADAPRDGQALFLFENPSFAVAEVCGKVLERNRPPRRRGVHPTAVVDPDAEVHPESWIGPKCVVSAGARIAAGCELEAQCFVGRNVSIGADSRLRPGVVLEDDTQVGSRCILHAGVVIGADGFGYDSSASGHRKIPQVGNVVVGDDVEIGANSTIDRARFAETRIGRGTKIDNLVQIGHNVVTGEHCVFCALAGVSGSTRIGNFVTLAGQVGVAGHLEIGDQVMVGGQSGVSRNLPEAGAYTGTPARPLKEQRRLEAWVRRLPEMHERLDALRSRLKDLEEESAV